VVGPADEEIFTDKYGRVKVKFHWDRQGTKDADSSCWIRVGTPWAGKGWGLVHVPRVGQEVIVDFLEGDPDNPIIIGSVYNAETVPPYQLPNSRRISGVKSNSTPGGGGYNELTFDDTKDKEKITLHAQEDLCTIVRHDHRDTVHNDRTIVVEGKHTETIVKDTRIEITEGNVELLIDKGTLTRTVAKDVTDTFAANHKVSVKDESKLDAGKVMVTALQEITLQVGGNYIRIDATGITMFGTLVKIN
jgi:type VI secretion system secreted protein VgrG